MCNFLVLGLPRSRTAWLANFLTYDDITCTHEGLNGCKNLTDYLSKFKTKSGDSNTGLMMFDFERYFRDFKIIIIDNTIDAAVEFSKRYYSHDSTQFMLKAQRRLSRIEGLHVPFKSINDNLEKIWDYVSGEQFNESRAKFLINLTVEIRDPYFADEDSVKTLIKNTKNYFK